MEKENYLEDLSEIKKLMSESSKFLQFTTGLSGIFSGLFAMVGMLYLYLEVEGNVLGITNLVESQRPLILILLTLIFVLSTLTTIVFTRVKVKKTEKETWNSTSKKMVLSFYSVLCIGGIYLFIQFFQSQYESIVELMLIFYGIALLYGSKYTFEQIKYLGYVQILLGLTCTLVPEYDYWFWVTGFGFVNLIYGCVMYFGYGK